MTPFSLDGRVAVVTGAGTGLGAAIARALADAGATVICAGRRLDLVEGTAKDIESRGGAAGALSLDISDEAAVAGTFARLRDQHGSLDVLVNNAAIVHEQGVLQVSPADWRSVLDVNLTGTFLCCQAFAAQEPDRDRSIVNVSSLAGTAGVAGQAAYSASKGGVEALTRALAIELVRRRVRVNTIAPGYLNTDMPAEVVGDPRLAPKLLARIPMRRLGEPGEVAPAAVFLASEASRYMTGAIVAVDGGYTAR
jgi:gluconate 5-dehydrogenase